MFVEDIYHEKNLCQQTLDTDSVVFLVGDVYAGGLKHHNHKAD